MSRWLWQNVGPDDDQVRALLARWAEVGPPPTAEVLKPGRVWAIGEVVVKQAPYRRLRRAALGWQRVQAVAASPQPLLLGQHGARGLLAMRRCRGVPLRQVWHEPAARLAFADLVTALFARRIIHGDLHLNNLLWDGTRLWLIDLDGLRPVLHRWLWKRQFRKQWAWLVHRMADPSTLPALHARCCCALGIAPVERHWALVLQEAARLRKRDQRRPPRQPQLVPDVPTRGLEPPP